MDIKIKKVHPDAIIPEFKTVGSAGADICSLEEVLIPGNTTMVLRTGIAMELPPGYECQMRPRSGLSLNSPLRITLGTIDSDYRGEIHIILDNISDRGYQVLKGTRLAQLIFHKVEHPIFKEVNKLSRTERASQGFGSTGAR